MHFHVASCPELLMEQFLNKISLAEAIQIYAGSVDFYKPREALGLFKRIATHIAKGRYMYQ